MYFDFEDNRPDITPVGGAITWREGILLSITLHLVAILGVVMMPELPGASEARARIEQRLQAIQERQREAERFVFVQPLEDVPAPVPPSPDADASDMDRVARAPERAEKPTNPLPYSRGNTPEMVDSPPVPGPPQPSAPTPASPPSPSTHSPGPDAGDRGDGEATKPSSQLLGPGGLRLPRQFDGAGRDSVGRGTGSDGIGVISRALQDLQRYIPAEQFENQGGGAGAYGPSIQFDTKGVEFGPWIRRFVAQIKRNWFLPYAAMAMKGHVVVTFYVMKDGRLEELTVAQPCSIEAFNNSSYNALAASNPTHPLPPEYPAERAFFTVTFYYNETPPR